MPITIARFAQTEKVHVAGTRIAAAEAKTLADVGEAIILDVVVLPEWPAMTRFIQGSVRIPPEEIEQRFGELPADKTIITYCTRPDEFTSARFVKPPRYGRQYNRHIAL